MDNPNCSEIESKEEAKILSEVINSTGIYEFKRPKSYDWRKTMPDNFKNPPCQDEQEYMLEEHKRQHESMSYYDEWMFQRDRLALEFKARVDGNCLNLECLKKKAKTISDPCWPCTWCENCGSDVYINKSYNPDRALILSGADRKTLWELFKPYAAQYDKVKAFSYEFDVEKKDKIFRVQN